MHNSYIGHLDDGPRAKGQVCKFQNLERLSEKKLQYVCITSTQCNLRFAQSCHQTGSACKGKPKRLTLLSGNGGTPPLPSPSSPAAIICSSSKRPKGFLLGPSSHGSSRDALLVVGVVPFHRFAGRQRPWLICWYLSLICWCLAATLSPHHHAEVMHIRKFDGAKAGHFPDQPL